MSHTPVMLLPADHVLTCRLLRTCCGQPDWGGRALDVFFASALPPGQPLWAGLLINT